MRKLFLLLFFLCLHYAEAQGINSFEKELEAHIGGEFSRGLGAYADFGIAGAIEINDIWFFKGGAALGKTEYDYDIKAFTNAGMQIFKNFPLVFTIAYIYNGLPEYDVNSHTVLPVIAINGKRAGIAAGVSFRFTSFFGGDAVFEPVLSFAGYLNFFNNERFLLGIRCANYSDFYPGNMGAYLLSLNSAINLGAINLGQQWTILAALELIQSGSVALSANFYGIAIRGGIRYSW